MKADDCEKAIYILHKIIWDDAPVPKVTLDEAVLFACECIDKVKKAEEIFSAEGGE